MFLSNSDVFSFVNDFVSYLDGSGRHNEANKLRGALSASQSSSEVLGCVLLVLLDFKKERVFMEEKYSESVDELISAIKKAQDG